MSAKTFTMMDISLTTDNHLVRVSSENERPGLGRPSLNAMDGASTTPTIAYPEILANGNLIGAERAMSYQPAGFVKIPRSLFTHPVWDKTKPKYRQIFLEFMFRATWAPTFFYWNGIRVDLSIGQLYFSRRKFSEEISGSAQKDEKISESDIRGAVRHFERCGFLTQHLTQHLTQPPTIISILYSAFCDDDKYSSNPTSNPTSNPGLTQVSPTKEEDKEHKEKKKNKSPRKSAAVDNAEALRLCSNFVELLKKTLPDLKVPANLSKWQSEFDLMLRVDQRSVKDIEFLFEKMPGHFYSKNVQCASKFREKFAVLKAYHTEVNEGSQAGINRSWFLETKKDNARELRDWTASGEWVLNSRNSKEISLKMGHAEFKKAFLASVGGKEIG